MIASVRQRNGAAMDFRWLGRWLIAGIAVALLLAGPVHAQSGTPIVVYAAAALKNVIDEAMADWMKRTGQAVIASYSHAPALAKQIEQGAPADLFISADSDWMDYLDQRNLIDRTSRIALVGNSLVLIAQVGDPIQIKLARGVDLATLVGNDRIAVCTIASCPGGKYAKAALEGLGMWEAVKGKLVDQETIRIALAAVARGEVKFAIVYSTDAAIEPKVRVVDTFPTESHPPVIFPAAVVGASAHPAARQFLDFLRSQTGAAIFRKYGFVVPQQD
jgi:molybdate transport system substrate-binding protein